MRSLPLVSFFGLVLVMLFFIAWPSQKVTVSCPPAESYCTAYVEAPSDFGQAVSLTGRKVVPSFNHPEPHAYLYLMLEYRTPGGEIGKKNFAYKESLLVPTPFFSVSDVRAHVKNKKGEVVASTVIH